MFNSTPATLFKSSLLPSNGVQSLIPPIKSTIPTSNVGATVTTPTPSPAKSAYMSSIAPTVSSVQPTQTQPITGNTTTPSGTVVNATTGATVSTPTPPANAAYTDAYNRYIQSLTPSDAENSATTNLNNLTLQSQKDQADAFYRNGGTTTSAGEESNKINRDESFGIDAASNALSAITGQRTATTNAAKARADFENSLLQDKATADKTAFDENQTIKNAAQSQSNSDRTFAENQKEFGLDYALKQQAQNFTENQNSNVPNLAKANQPGFDSTGVKYNTTNATNEILSDVQNQGLMGTRKLIPPSNYNQYQAWWVQQLLPVSDFKSIFGQYINPDKKAEYN